MIELNNIDVFFQSDDHLIKACDDVNLKVDKADIFGIVGYSGAGKSTLVRTINLLQRPSKGQVFIEDEEITQFSDAQLRQKRKEIGMIFQSFNLMNARTVFENVYYPIRKDKLAEEEKRAWVESLLELVGIPDKANAYPRQLSGGQKQRVAIARALATKPKVLLCDEATSALDPKTTHSILKLLKDLNQRLSLTIVIITHEMQVVKEICNKCAVMEEGRVVEYGSVVDIFANPKEQLTKEFIDTTTHKDQTTKKIKANLKNKDNLYYLQFIGQGTHEPFMVGLYKKFGVETNVLSGNIEYIANTPIGNLTVQFVGEDNRIKEALADLKSNGIEAEVI